MVPKDWAKGLTASTDPRVARAAAAHRGMAYRPRTIHRRAALDWTPAFAYAVGLLATDGCLVTGRKRVDFVSADRELVESLLSCLHRPARIRECVGREERTYFRVQICDAALYRRLLEIGLTPRKSLTLGQLVVPETLFPHCLRGLMDGDGGIYNFVDAPTKRSHPNYRYERLVVKFYSASRDHIEWLADRIATLYGVRGSVTASRGGISYSLVHALAFGKHASIALLQEIYVTGAPRLMRKFLVWEGYAARHGLVAERVS